jgi:pimeloyl-ACP methyl ester carboxylesterase
VAALAPGSLALSAPRVLLVHGLMMRSPALLPMAWRLRKFGFTPELFNYATLWKAPGIAMERLALRLYAMGPEPVHLVAHSLGGLIVLETLGHYQGLPPGRVVCMGAPIAGSTAARGLAGHGLGVVAGRSGPLLRAGLASLPRGRQIGMIAGTSSVGLGKFFSRLDNENDGTVAVWETRLPGLTDHAVVQSSHSGLVFSPQVAELTARFLDSGRFRP